MKKSTADKRRGKKRSIRVFTRLLCAILIALLFNSMDAQAVNKTAAWDFLNYTSGWTAGNGAGMNAPGTNTTTTATAFTTFAYSSTGGNPTGYWSAITPAVNKTQYMGNITQTFVAPGTGTVNAKGLFDYYLSSSNVVANTYVRLDILDSTGATFVGSLGGVSLSAATAWTTSSWSGNVALTGGTTYTIMATLAVKTPTTGASAVTIGIDNIVVNVAPIGLSSTGQMPNSVSLSWTASSPTVGPALYGYNVYQSPTSGGPYTKANGSIISATTYTVSGLNANTTYYFVVTDVDKGKDGTGGTADDMESPYSAQLTQATPAITVTVGGLASYPPPVSVQQGNTNIAMLKFQLSANGTGASWTGGKLDKIGTNTNLGDVTFDIYRNTANNGTFSSASDVKIGSGSFSAATGQAYTLTAGESIPTATQWYFIIYDISNTAATATTVGARIAGNTYFTVTGGGATVGAVTSTSSGTPTINAGTCVRSAPSLAVTPASAAVPRGGSKAYTLTITDNDNFFCSNSTFNISSSSETGQTASFTLPSTYSPASCTLGYQGVCTSILTVTAKVAVTDGDVLTTAILVRDSTNHSGLDGTGSVVTTVRDFMLHNSAITKSSAWSANGGWGLTGTKYGKFDCTTCHTKTTTNIKRIKTGIGTPDGTNWVSSGTRTVSVTFTSTTTPNGFGDDTTSHTTSTKICEVCHSQNGFHNYNQTTAQTHQNNADCMASCHSHNTGFVGDGPCKSCHNAAINEVYNVRKIVETTTGDGTGEFVRLSRHVSNGSTTEIVTSYDCIICHAEGDAVAAAAKTGYVDRSMHRNGSTSTTRMVKLRNVDNITQTYDWNNNAPTETMRTNMDTFCLNCHDSNGASAIAVAGVYTSPSLSLSPTAAKALTPFNDSDTIQNGRDNLTTRTRVINIKDMFYAGTASGASYNGNPSQHAVLGARYSTTDPGGGWTAAAWSGGTLRNGTIMSTARETARLHCSDCHLVESSAHGAANAWHMLLSGTPGDYTTDYAMTGSTDATTASIVCYRCHNSATYSNTTTNTASRFYHGDDSNVWGQAYGAGSSAKLGMTCLNCHAGDGFGNIHGISGTYASNGGTYTRYRFMNGAVMYRQPGTALNDNAWTESGTTPNCYFPTNTPTYSNCTHHGSGSTGSGQLNNIYGRAVKY